MATARVKLIITNTTGATLTCTDIGCEAFDVTPLNVGDTIPPGGTGTYASSTNDRIFCTWKSSVGGGVFQMGMTTPKSSSNSAYGSFYAGLQNYQGSGTPCTFTYVPGTPNEADWNDPNQDNGTTVAYCDCSG